MRIAVVGCGHVGLTTAACLAHIGHDVVGVDADAERVAIVARGDVPFHEPGLAELVREGMDARRLRATEHVSDAVSNADVVFVCVATPPNANGGADLSQVESAVDSVARSLSGYTVVATKSTVPVQTGGWLRSAIARGRPPGAEFDVASNPEFLREGRAVLDTLEPERIVVGTDSKRAVDVLREVFRPILGRTGCPFVVTDVPTAELIKHASNAYLATKISFINTIADVCEETGADVEVVAAAMGLDSRIGSAFLRAGIGYGGDCLPKDVKAFREKAKQLGVDTGILDAVERVNHSRVERLLEKVRSLTGGVARRRIGVWGLAFKPETDDVRWSPALDVVERLIEEGADVAVYDPVAMPAAKARLDGVTFASDALEAAREADCLVVCTEWREFAEADLHALREEMRTPVVVDGRNVFHPDTMAAAGFAYAGVGRPTHAPERSEAR